MTTGDMVAGEGGKATPAGWPLQPGKSKVAEWDNVEAE